MQNQEEYLLVINTCPDEAFARHLAGKIIDEKIAKCVNILPKITSVYEWRGKKETSAESLLFIKINREMYTPLQELIVKEHPYELPEVVAVPICDGLPEYLSWLSDNLQNSLKNK